VSVVVDTSAVSCMEILVFKMTYHGSSVTLKLLKSVFRGLACLSQFYSIIVIKCHLIFFLSLRNVVNFWLFVPRFILFYFFNSCFNV